MIQNRMQEQDGNDVTSMVGAGADEAAQKLFDTFRETLATAREKPSVNNFRTCVEAFDQWQALFLQQVQQ